MRAALWLLALFGVAVAAALFAGNNQGTVTLYWPPYRIDLSLNMVVLLLVGSFVTIYAALRAHALYHKDQQYVVQNGEVVIVDEFTGRLMPGRRWSDGLHQAVEAKEGVRIQAENQTLASITFQNYFRMYGKLAGMTGTADTEAFEFHSIYSLETVVIPTNRPMQRKDGNDKVYRTAKEKWDAVIEDIRSCVERGQPVPAYFSSIGIP